MAATYTYLSERLCANRMYVPQDDFYRKQNTEKEESKAKKRGLPYAYLPLEERLSSFSFPSSHFP